MTKPFEPGHPEQDAYDQTCSMWLTEGTNDREKHARVLLLTLSAKP